jgi:hypothetical protein
MIQVMKTTLLAWLCMTWWCVALLPGVARAQGFFNMEYLNLYGATATKSQAIPGTSATVKGTVVVWQENGYAYQVARTKAAGLWVEVFAPNSYLTSPDARTSVPASTFSMGSSITAPGFRFMAPVQKRVSVFGAAGGGVGFFNSAELGPGPTVLTHSVIHGVFDFGGGVDVRLNRRLSIRTDVRDFVTGRGLSGVPGRNHTIAAAGLVMHF